MKLTDLEKAFLENESYSLTYYNDIDIQKTEWLKQLVKNGCISSGHVSQCDIKDIDPNELQKYKKVHLFAGIGGWDHALNLAGWEDRPVWTASLPCQPFSSAGKQKGKYDERHLLPHFLNLVRECHPDTITGYRSNCSRMAR